MPKAKKTKFSFFIYMALAVSVPLYLLLHMQPLPKADFTYVLVDSIKTLDPAKVSWNEDVRIALGLWEGLFSYHPKTVQPIPGVAIGSPMISDDQLTYTFTLRQDARWSNGDPVTASDFVYAWRRAIEPGTAGEYAFFVTDNIAGAKEYYTWRNNAVRTLTLLSDLQKDKTLSPEDQQFIASQNLLPPSPSLQQITQIADQYRQNHLQNIESKFQQVQIRALDPHTLRLTLSRPLPYLFDLLAFATFLPIHKASIEKLRVTDDPVVTDLTLWAFDPQWTKSDYHQHEYPGLITNGAFALKRWEFKRYMLFEKNPFYWDRSQVALQTIMARIITEANTAFLAYERGQIDYLRNLTNLDFAPELYQKMNAGLRPDFHHTLAFGTYYYSFNCHPHLTDGSLNPFHDPNVRMAFNLAIDKQAIVDNVKKLGNPPARNFVPPGAIHGYSCPPGPDYNPSRAKTLLQQAGFPDGKNLPAIEILYNTGQGHENLAQTVALMWQKNLHVKVILKGKELKSFDEDRINHRYMVCRASWYGDYLDPTTFLDLMDTENPQNDAGFSNPEYDQILRQAAESQDTQQRFELLARAESLLIQQEIPMMPIYYYVNFMAVKEQVKGLYSNPRDMQLFKAIQVHK